MICNCNQCYQLLGRGGNTENILFADDESNFPKSNQSFDSQPYIPKYSKLQSPSRNQNTGLKYITNYINPINV